MIEYVQGRILEKSPTRLLLLCGGVGYGLNISISTFEDLPDLEQEAGLYTYLSVREDAMVLFGFSTLSEREMFVLLTGVKGVGPKTALGILSGMGADQLSDHIASGNAQALVSIPGIGKKSAERLVLELRDKIDRVAVVQSSAASGGDGSAKALVRGDALSALLELGYHRTAAERAIRAALKSHPDAESSVESMIKGALREMQR